MRVLKVKVISLPYIFQVLYVLCFTRPRFQVSDYRTIGPLVMLQFAKASTETNKSAVPPPTVNPCPAKPTETKEYTDARLQVRSS